MTNDDHRPRCKGCGGPLDDPDGVACDSSCWEMFRLTGGWWTAGAVEAFQSAEALQPMARALCSAMLRHRLPSWDLESWAPGKAGELRVAMMQVCDELDPDPQALLITAGDGGKP